MPTRRAQRARRRHIRAEIARAAAGFRSRLHGAGALRAGPRVLRRRRAQVRRGRRFRHGARDDAALRAARSPCRSRRSSAAPDARSVELGAGSGGLAADLLNALAARRAAVALRDPRSRARNCASGSTRRSSGRNGARRAGRVARPAAGGDRRRVIENEVLDAVRATSRRTARGRMVRAGVAWQRRACASRTGRCGDARAAGARAGALSRRRRLPQRSQSRRRGAGHDDRAAHRSGALLFVDYGFPRREYYHPQRSEGTLMCHYRHRAHADPFLWPGLADITAHVDFSAMARSRRARRPRTSPASQRRRLS